MFTFTIVTLLATLTASTLATPISIYDHYAPVKVAVAPAPALAIAHHGAVEIEHYAPAQYEFKYGVKDEHTGDIKEQAEKRNGDKVEGYYKLVEPDGTIRTVHYTADKHTGFNAIVEKSGHATHPAPILKKVVVPVKKVVAAAPVITYSHAAPLYTHSVPRYSYH
ncbi:cuticle protein 7-like [Zootermopsis nevadensis]|uniref:cuticle protein 7-like n=1 Tax=Zootermopsis nevadensis TaxID=136037 RepID=UPI000B8ECAB7|nr:cuticle protein 7-like [Zootermopsis nevadensis]